MISGIQVTNGPTVDRNGRNGTANEALSSYAAKSVSAEQKLDRRVVVVIIAACNEERFVLAAPALSPIWRAQLSTTRLPRQRSTRRF